MTSLPSPVPALMVADLGPAPDLRTRPTDRRVVVDVVGVVVGDLRCPGRTGDRSLFVWSPVNRDQVRDDLVPLVAETGLDPARDPRVQPP
ncbi:MAG: hypothetical protein ACREQ5_24250, partial [Candidatus Dormibacteria bacterium]